MSVRRNGHLLLPVMAAAALVLTACGDDGQGGDVLGEPTTEPPRTQGESGGQPVGELPTNGAPAVPEPIEDTKKFEDDPCSTFTEDQLAKIGVPPDGTREDPPGIGPVCMWMKPGGGSRVEIRWVTETGTGLSQVYGGRDTFTRFDEHQIDGYPVVAVQIPSHDKDEKCAVHVGVRDTLSVSVSIGLGRNSVGEKDPCEAGKTVAERALKTIRGG